MNVLIVSIVLLMFKIAYVPIVMVILKSGQSKFWVNCNCLNKFNSSYEVYGFRFEEGFKIFDRYL